MRWGETWDQGRGCLRRDRTRGLVGQPNLVRGAKDASMRQSSRRACKALHDTKICHSSLCAHMANPVGTLSLFAMAISLELIMLTMSSSQSFCSFSYDSVIICRCYIGSLHKIDQVSVHAIGQAVIERNHQVNYKPGIQNCSSSRGI
jgi:hypothetical protein